MFSFCADLSWVIFCFNKALLIEDEDAREALTNKLAELFSRQGSKKSWDENLEKYI